MKKKKLYIKVNEFIMEGFNTRNIYVDRIWFHIKQTIRTKRQGYCLYISDNLYDNHIPLYSSLYVL